MNDASDFRNQVTYGYFNIRTGLNDGLISPILLLLKYENSLFRIELKEKKISKTSELNFSANLNKEQLDIKFNQLSLNSTLRNIQRCPQQTNVSCPDRISLGLSQLLISPFLLELCHPFSGMLKVTLLDIVYNSGTLHRSISIKPSPNGPYHLHQMQTLKKHIYICFSNANKTLVRFLNQNLFCHSTKSIL